MNSVDLNEFENQLLSFERAWRSGEPPDIGQFGGKADNSAQPLLFVELAKIDLEHRLRNGFEAAAESYAAIFPDLDDEEIRWDLVSCEFELRAKFMRPLTDPQLETRFGHQADRARQLADSCNTHCSATIRVHRGAGGNVNVDLRPGCQVNQYTIERLLGSGSFAVVYAARDNQLGRRVALKFLQPDEPWHPDSQARTVREAHAVAALHHPGIVPIFETGTFGDLPFIASQYVDGQSLDQLLADRTFDINQSVELVGQLAGALAHAHTRGVVHRDIKPANIMIQNGRPMLLDFGLARVDDASVQLTTAGDMLGTPAYMPPEQADGRAWQADPRSDVYSLGVLLYRMTSGRLPFEGSMAQVVHQVIHQTPASPRRYNRRIPGDLETIVLKCLEKDPADRYQTAPALESDLHNFLAGNSIQARPATLVGKAIKWSKRKPVMAALILALLMGTAFLVGISSQLVRVSQQRDRANRAEADLQGLLALEAANAGRLSMQRGQLAAAVDHFRQSIAMGYSDPVELRLRIVESLVATRQLDLAKQDLDRLIGDAAPTGMDQRVRPSGQGEIYLWQSQLSLDHVGSFGDPIELLKQAQACELPEAARHFVDAMLAKRSPDALAGFRKALVADPFHHRSRRMLILMLVSLARFNEALNETMMARELFPEDPDFVLFQSIIMAARGELDACRPLIDSAGLDSETATQWMAFCQTIDQVTGHLVIHEGDMGFDQSAIRQVVDRFGEQHLPLLVERGLHFPPNIAPQIGSLLDNIMLVSASQVANVGDAKETVELLEQLVEVHPEGSLLSLYAERVATLYNLQSEELAKNDRLPDPQLLQMSLDAFQRSSEQPGFVQSVQTTSWIGILGCSLGLAHVHKIDQQQNIARFVYAAGQIDPRQMRLGLDGIRGIVITLLKARAYDDAESWADRWVELAGEDDFDAVWHRLMVDRWRLRWYDVIRRCNAAIARMPDEHLLSDLRQRAVTELKREITSPETK